MASNLEQSFKEDTHDRNFLQVEIIREILGSDSTEEERLAWVVKHRKELRDIIDSSEHKEDVADLARAGNYKGAAKKVLEILSAGNSDEKEVA